MEGWPSSRRTLFSRKIKRICNYILKNIREFVRILMGVVTREILRRIRWKGLVNSSTQMVQLILEIGLTANNMDTDKS
jgi:hypothetical protein